VELLPAGIWIALQGMALVFALLALLWGVVAALLRTEREQAAPEAPARPGAKQELAPALVTAITIAVLTHRRLQRKEAAPAARSHQPGALLHASRWVAAGRTRQNRSWPPGRG